MMSISANAFGSGGAKAVGGCGWVGNEYKCSHYTPAPKAPSKNMDKVVGIYKATSDHCSIQITKVGPLRFMIEYYNKNGYMSNCENIRPIYGVSYPLGYGYIYSDNNPRMERMEIRFSSDFNSFEFNPDYGDDNSIVVTYKRIQN